LVEVEPPLLRAVLDALPLHVFWKGVDSRYLGCNAAFARDAGLAHPADVVGRTDADLFWAAAAARYRADDAQVIATARPLPPFEEPWKRPDGSTRWVRTEKRPLFDPEGRVIGILGVCEDVTRTHEAELRLRLTARILEESREAVMVTDPDGVIVEVNEAFTRLTGYSRAEALGRTPRLLSSGRHGPEFYRALWRSIQETGQWQGEIWNRRKSGDLYAEQLTITAVRDEAGELRHYVGQFTDITAAKAQQEQLARVTHYDSLTGLPNRLLLVELLEGAMRAAERTSTRLALVYLDLDDFSRFNERHGDQAGDILLLRVAEGLSTALRENADAAEGEALARVGGDEFVALLPGLAEDEAGLGVRLARLQAAARLSLSIDGMQEECSGSLGVTLFPQAEPVAAEQLLRQSEQALYQAKLAGRHRVHYYDEAREGAQRRRHRALTELRAALLRDELVLHYQPKVHLQSGALLGVEALLRWQHPERGLVPPGEFLPLIEDSLLAVDIGDWVLRTALDQIRTWKSAGLPLGISVNLSAIQLQQPDFIGYLGQCMQAFSGIGPGELELEILESSAIEDIAAVSRMVEAARGLGVDFALDDFGTGYSSLTYLRRLPARTLKIDRSFVLDMLHDAEDLSIIGGILGLARAFERRVIAEGVETLAHGLALLALGVEWGQGYAIARPMPGAAIPGWVQAWRPPEQWVNAGPQNSSS
jgi:diguanylate cyclase (GGDEF)-like protein/PAS domain S-box-containing protein